MHAVSTSTSRPRRWRCRVLRRKAFSTSKLSRTSTSSPTRWISCRPRTAVIDQAEFGLGLAQHKSRCCWLAAGAARGRAVPQDLRAGTQHRPMEMRRAGIAFITWGHVCALFVRFAISCSRRVTLQADVSSIPKDLVRLNKNKTYAVRSLIDDAGGTK